MAIEALIENNVPNVGAVVRRHDAGKFSLCSVTVHGLPLCTAVIPIQVLGRFCVFTYQVRTAPAGVSAI